MAHVRGEKLEKAKSLKIKLNDCGDVVERCREALQKSEDELQKLKRIVSELKCFSSEWIILYRKRENKSDMLAMCVCLVAVKEFIGH